MAVVMQHQALRELIQFVEITWVAFHIKGGYLFFFHPTALKAVEYEPKKRKGNESFTAKIPFLYERLADAVFHRLFRSPGLFE